MYNEKNKKKILVIDDLKTNFLIIQNILRPPEWELTFIQDPLMALAHLENSVPDLILMDQEMPHLNGDILCRQIKSSPKLKVIPVVFVTASPAEVVITAAFEAGADDYLSKPIVPSELLSRINRILETKNLQHQLRMRLDNQVSLSRILSHDLNNFLSIIDGSTTNLERFCMKFPDHYASQEGAFSKIKRTTKRMDDLIKNVRSILTLDSHKADLNLINTPVGDLIAEGIEIYQDRIHQKNIKLKVENALDSDVMKSPIVLDKNSALNSVFGNVLSNAIKFSYEGAAINIKVIDGPKFISLKIRDFGMGMDKDLLGKIFSMAEKTTRPGTAKEMGTGFGMPLVKLFMEKYGGAVTVDSTSESENPENHGTTIELKFKKAA